MMNRKMQIGMGCLAAAVVFGLYGKADAAGGTLDSSDGPLIVSQTNVTTSQNANGGGPSGIGNEATASSTGNFTQLSNVHAQITGTGSAATLTLFIAGSVTQDTDTKIDIALQTNSSGVGSLSGQTLAGASNSANLDNITFDTGFKPNAFIVLDTNTDQNGGTTNGIYDLGAAYGVTDLTHTGHTTTVSGTLNNALVNTPVGTGATGDPGFSGANTGLELTIPLSSLGYTDGTAVEALAFPSVGSDNRTDNQILAPFTYNTGDSSGGYDYTYFDNNEGGQPGRQFTGVDYIGNQYFTVDGLVTGPEPTSLGLLGIAAAPMIFGRRRKLQAAAE